MATPSSLSTPPIREALIDVRVASTDKEDKGLAERLKALIPRLKEDFPSVEAGDKMSTHIEVGPAGVRTETKSEGFIGIKCKSSDGFTVAQFRPESFTFNRLRPYTGWENLQESAMNYWRLYEQARGGKTVSRVAVRYINEMGLPLRHGDAIERFLLSVPPATAGGYSVGAFLLKMLMHGPPALMANVTQRLDPAPGVGHPCPYFLDIDAYTQQLQGGEVDDVLSRLREFKNKMFFSLLSDEALEPYR